MPTVPEASVLENVIDSLEDIALDPCLEQCCRRDAEQQIKIARLKQQLRAVDRSDAAIRMQNAVFATSDHQHASPNLQHQHSDSSLDLDSEDDPVLQQLRQQRMQQLQSAAQQNSRLQQEGYGRVNEVSASSVQGLLEDTPRCILHVAAEGWPACDQLDELLTSVAYRYSSTYFARLAVPKATPAHQQAAQVGGLKLPHGLPALLVARHGSMVGSAPVVRFGGAAEVIEDEVMGYLHRLKVLKAVGDAPAAAATGRGPGQGPASSDEDQDSEEDGGADGSCGAPCELCGRTYPHEHVRAAYATRHCDSDEE